jgi:hypothetical protein
VIGRLRQRSDDDGVAAIFDRSGAVAAPTWRDLTREGRALFRDPRRFRAAGQPLPLPRGDGHPVIVIPPFCCSDAMTRGFRALLASLGYAPVGWGIGINLGPTAAAVAGVDEVLRRVSERAGRRASLVGYSLGGVFARALGSEYPTLVRRVITVCSPFRLPTASPVAPLYRALSRWHVAHDAVLARLAAPPSVPTTAIYTREDGIVAWTSCRDDELPGCDNVAIPGAHTTMLGNPLAIRVIAERLGRPELSSPQWPD